MKKHIFAALLSVIVAYPQAAWGKDEEIFTADQVDPGDPTKVYAEFKFAPTVSDSFSATPGDRVNDKRTSYLSFSVDHDFSERWQLKTSITGNYATSDSNESAVEASATLVWKRGFRRVSPSLNYTYEAPFDDFYGTDKHDTHSIKLNLNTSVIRLPFCGENLGGECKGNTLLHLKVAPFGERLFIAKDEKKRWTAGVKLEAEGNLMKGVGWSLGGSYEHRIYDQRIAGKNEEPVWKASAGIELADLFESGRGLHISEFSIGISYQGTDLRDKPFENQAEFTPAIKLRWDLD